MIAMKDMERLKRASRGLLASFREVHWSKRIWTERELTRAEVEVQILDGLYALLPRPLFAVEDAQSVDVETYDYIFQRSKAETLFIEAAA